MKTRKLHNFQCNIVTWRSAISKFCLIFFVQIIELELQRARARNERIIRERIMAQTQRALTQHNSITNPRILTLHNSTHNQRVRIYQIFTLPPIHQRAAVPNVEVTRSLITNRYIENQIIANFVNRNNERTANERTL